MRRWLQDLAIGAIPFIAGIVGYLLALAVEPNQTVCHGAPIDGAYYCDTHAGNWEIVGLVFGLVIGAAVAVLLVRRRNRLRTD